MVSPTPAEASSSFWILIALGVTALFSVILSARASGACHGAGPDKQDSSINDTPTAGYAVLNISGSYTFVTKRVTHVVLVNGYNLGNTLYRTHLWFVKTIAPEIGRNIRLN